MQIEPMRKELVRLISRSECHGNSEELGSCPDRKHGLCQELARLSYCVIQNLANHLIANGVRVPVRCEKCKHFKRGPQKHKCLNPFGGMLWPQPEDWCSYGERRTDDGT